MTELKWVRVKDNETKHEYSTRVPREGETVLKKDATDRFGVALLPKPYRRGLEVAAA